MEVTHFQQQNGAILEFFQLYRQARKTALLASSF